MNFFFFSLSTNNPWYNKNLIEFEEIFQHFVCKHSSIQATYYMLMLEDAGVGIKRAG